ncbi:ankyrin repeat-containing domain protein [Sporodiniella umbellata]|nr:ankyrin repeat-containing domain protein [Sporodiniella umbellata]
MDRLVRRYFEAGGNPNVARLHRPIDRLKVGYSLVHALVLAGSTESLEIALQAGANPNYTPATENPGDMISPLVLAAREKSIDSVQLLVIYGARLFHSKGALGEGPLHAAVFSNSENIVYYLLKKSQNHLLKTTDFTGATPLHYAAMKGRCRIVLLFIKKGLLDLNCQDNNGDIPLHYAIRHRRLNMVKLLIEMSTNTHINVSDLLKLAKKNNAGAIAHYLRQIEVDVLNTKKVDSTKVCSENSKSECKYGCICVYNIGKLFKKHVVTKAHRLIKKNEIITIL